ncbi:hypothetical protein [Streptomyces tubercidicus]|uniref:hypothetical protein n=1 Tax=Streptomyces tubercidicus TaxID=47759 RepID=UPI0036CDDC36
MYQVVKDRPGLPIVDDCTRADFRDAGHCGEYKGVVVGKCGRCWDCHAIKNDPQQLRTEEIKPSDVREGDCLVFSESNGVEVFRVKVIDIFPGRFFPGEDDTEGPGDCWYRFSCHGGPVAARDMDQPVTIVTRDEQG